jgi:hypothetical protein
MNITLSNISDAVSSADAHKAYAVAMELVGNKRLARKHDKHAKAIMREVMVLTDPGECNLSDDELLAELEA